MIAANKDQLFKDYHSFMEWAGKQSEKFRFACSMDMIAGTLVVD